MTGLAVAAAPAGDTGFLVVDAFLRTIVDARALKTAFELGVIDRLASHRSGSAEAFARTLGFDPPGSVILLDLLAANRVVERSGGELRLSRHFRQALRYRDLLEAKLDFCGAVLTDFADLFTLLVQNPGGFQSRARLFELFDYRRCLRFTPEDYVRTRAWMRITSALSRYEAAPCMAVHDFSAHRRAMDVGGNSGEFLVQLCRANPGLSGTVVDLPLVCEIGLEHVLTQPEHARVGFRPTDLRTETLPGGHDLVTFKSMLHDWPMDDAARFLAKAADALAPGGTLLIYERGPLRLDATPPMSMLPHILFFRSYRPAESYVAAFAGLGLRDVAVRDVELDGAFFVVTARKPA